MMDEWISFIRYELENKDKREWDELDWDSYYYILTLDQTDA